MLGIGSGWTQLFGLLIDAVGFWLLAWDILPEYRANRMARLLAASAQTGAELADGTHPYRDKDEPSVLDDLRAVARHEKEKIDNHLAWLNVFMCRDQLREVADYSGVGDNPKVRPALGTGAFDKRAFEAAHKFVAKALNTKSAALLARKRPPIRLALGIIVIGYLVQAWGTVPVAS